MKIGDKGRWMDEDQIGAVEIVRSIRDRVYEETKDMSPREFMAYVRHAARWFADEHGRPPQSILDDPITPAG